MKAGRTPIVVVGDHRLSMGSVAGAARHAAETGLEGTQGRSSRVKQKKNRPRGTPFQVTIIVTFSSKFGSLDFVTAALAPLQQFDVALYFAQVGDGSGDPAAAAPKVRLDRKTR
jgi:hypothetical protein